MQQMVVDRVRAAIEAADWDAALALLDESDDTDRDPELLELRAQAAYGAGDFEGCVSAWEARHALLRDAGDRGGAAHAAAMVAMFLLIDAGLMSPVRGWLRRAERFLEAEEGPTDAVIAAVRGYERFFCGDLETAREQSDRAVALGRRFGVLAAEVIGRTARARLTIVAGRVDEGLEQLEDVGALLMSGEVDPLTTGMMLCEVVCAAQGLARHDLAVEWTDVMDRWQRGSAFGGLHGRCRVHRAELLRVSGPCDVAEDEALGACDDLRPWMRREFGWPLAELGNIRLRKGDLDGAEEAFLAAHEHVWCPHPGLALVRLAQGDVAAATALIDEAIAHPFQAPWKERPPVGDLPLAPLIEAQVEIAAAAGDVATAQRATRSLRKIADTYGGPWLLASAALAEARTALLVDDPARAKARSREAIAAWADIGAPYETAVARTVLAEAHARSGDEASARLEWETAAHAFESFGAERAAARARAPLDGGLLADDLGPPDTRPGPDGEASAATAVFRLDGGARQVIFGGTTRVLPDLKGYRYLGRMLADPGREFHVLDLVAVEQGTLPTGGPDAVGAVDPDLAGGRGLAGGGLPLLDEQARAAYRRRLDDVEDDLADALRCNDPARAELAERDRDYLITELSRAVGLGGRLRAVGSDAERARTAVTRTLRYAIDRLAEADPGLGAHLDNAVRTGTYCSYRPDPRSAVDWSV